MLYLRGTDKSQILAKKCIHVCESCLQQLSSQQSGREMVERACLDAIQSCMSIIKVSHQAEQLPGKSPLTMFYGVEMSEPMRCQY